MKHSPANRDAATGGREQRLRGRPCTEKSNAAKRVSIRTGQANAQPFEGDDGVRHQRLAAGLINRWLGSVGNHHAESLLAGGNRCRQPRRAASDDENIRGSQQCMNASPLQKY